MDESEKIKSSRKKDMVKSVVVEAALSPLLSRRAAEKMKMITVNYDKFKSVCGVAEAKHDIFQDFPDVLNDGVGTLSGSARLTMKPDAEPLLLPPKGCTC